MYVVCYDMICINGVMNNAFKTTQLHMAMFIKKVVIGNMNYLTYSLSQLLHIIYDDMYLVTCVNDSGPTNDPNI